MEGGGGGGTSHVPQGSEEGSLEVRDIVALQMDLVVALASHEGVLLGQRLNKAAEGVVPGLVCLEVLMPHSAWNEGLQVSVSLCFSNMSNVYIISSTQ